MNTGAVKQGGRLAGARGDFLLGAALGMLVFLLLYGPSTLDVTYDGWLYQGYMEYDTVQRYAGWMYFRADDWRWPLGVVENLSIPQGISIAYMDSVPWVAILCKLFAPLLPQTFQYFGWFQLFNFALQGGFALLLLRHFSLGRAYSGVASLLFLTMPVFIEKVFRHDALAAHWLVLAAVLLYFRALRKMQPSIWIGYGVLCVVSVGISAYFTPIVVGLLVATLLQWVVREKKWLKPALVLAACGVATLVSCYVLGMLTRNGGSVEGYSGSLGMNLNALVNPSSFNYFAPDEVYRWSAVLPVRPRPRAHYEGFNYLGMGLLLAWGCMLVRAVVAVLRGVRVAAGVAGRFLRRYWGLLAACLCFVAYAVSNVAWWDETQLFAIPLPNFVLSLFGIFRASGRMFWPVAYLLALCPVVFIARQVRFVILLKKPRLALWGRGLGLGLLVLVQLADLWGPLVDKHRHFSQHIQEESVFTGEDWKFFAQNYNQALLLNRAYDYALGAGIIRYNPEMKTNMIIANRGSFTLIKNEYTNMEQALQSGAPIEEGTLYITENEDTAHFIMTGLHPGAEGYHVAGLYLFANPRPGCPVQPLQRG